MKFLEGCRMSKTHGSAQVDLPRAPLSIFNLKVAIIVYSGLDSPTIVDEISGFFGEDPEQFIMRLGLFYFTALGQGGNYHQGFYGPLPVPNEKEHVSFVFSSIVSDQAQLDPRAGGQSYVLVCLVCHKSQVPKYMDRPAIEADFESKFAMIGDISEIGPMQEDFTRSLKLSLINGSN